MSTVTMCDFCGSTTRQASEVVKIKLPRDVLPDAITSTTNTGDIPADACRACAGEIHDLLDGLITRRLTASGPTEGEAR